MSTDVQEWIVMRDAQGGKGRYLKDHALRGEEDVLQWTDQPAEVWRLDRPSAEAYARVSYWSAIAVHESQVATPSESPAKEDP